MKAQRRHKLETNQLADWVGRSAQTARPFWPWALAGLAVLVLALVGWNFWASRAGADQARSWQEFLNARARMNQALSASNPGDAEDFLDIARRYPHSSVVPLARLYGADVYYHNGMTDLFNNRDAALAMFRNAEQTYAEVSKTNGGDRPLISSWAALGEARSLEAQGKLKEAIQKYEVVKDRWPTPGTETPEYRRTLIGQEAAERIAALRQPWAERFYAELEKAPPVAPAKPDRNEPPPAGGPPLPVFPGTGP